MSPQHRVLFVDDDERILDAMRRAVRSRFTMVPAQGGDAALAMLSAGDSFSVVVSDLRMPGMDGVTFLSKVRQAAPDSVRILLTGFGDMEAAMKAVNDGQIFRFLGKPCPSETVMQAVMAGIAQHDLIVAERELLEQTLQGSIQALADVLALVRPLAFARALRVRDFVGDFATRLGFPNPWQLEVAALLSQVGAASLSSELAAKIYYGRPLSDDERALAEQVPATAAAVIAHVPRLEPVRAILFAQHRDFGAPAPLAPGPWGRDIPLGARVLRVAFDFDVLVTQGLESHDALSAMSERGPRYDPDVLQDFILWHGERFRAVRTRDLPLDGLREGMTLAADLIGHNGVLLLARGQRVTARVLELIERHWLHEAVRGPVRVYLPGEDGAPAAPAAAAGTGRPAPVSPTPRGEYAVALP